MFTLYGYVFRLTGAAARGEPVQPEFSDDLVDMTVKGFLFSLLYLLVIVVGVVAVVGGALLGGLVSDAAAVVLAVVFGLVVTYIGPAVFTLYPATGSAINALSPGRIAEFAFTSKYFVSYLGFLLLLLVVNIGFFLLFFVLAITIIGLILVIPLVYLFGAYVAYLPAAYWGGTYYEAVQEGLVQRPESSDRPEPDATQTAY